MTSTSDWDALVAFDRQCYPVEWCVEAPWYHNAYAQGYSSWILLKEDKIIGNFQLREHRRNVLYIAGIAVLPHYQQHGLGKLVLNKLIELYGATELIARIHQDNVRAQRLFKSAGFEWTHEASDKLGKWNWVRRLPSISSKIFLPISSKM
ncbi:MAG: GNAT family N-acetyltransferase [Pseudomonadota bacterium]